MSSPRRSDRRTAPLRRPDDEPSFANQRLHPSESRDFYFKFLVGIEEAGYNLLLFTGTRDSPGRRSAFASGYNMLQLADGSIMVGGQVKSYGLVGCGPASATTPKLSVTG